MTLFQKPLLRAGWACLVLAFSISSLSASAQLEAGDTAPVITALQKDGQPVAADSLKGKVVLVDFWASWCAPCRKANKTLVEAYPSLVRDGLTVISLSIDNDNQAWEKAVVMDKLSWTQLHDPGGWDSPSALNWKVEALPTAYLIAPDGTIAMVDPNIEQIRKYLSTQKSTKP